MKIFLLISLILAAASACTFKQDVKFNKNWSGEMACVIDMSSLNTMLESAENQTDNLLNGPETQAKIQELKAVPGIKKVSAVETSNGIYRITYTFRDLESLNKSGNVLFSEEKAAKDFVYFALKDKQSLYFTLPFDGSQAPPADEDGDEQLVADNLSYELTMTFPKKITSLETQNGASLSADKKQVVFKSDIQTMTSRGFVPGMLIRFEK